MHNLTCGPLAATMRTINSPLLYLCFLVSMLVGKCGIFPPKIKSEKDLRVASVYSFSVHKLTECSMLMQLFIVYHGVMGLYAWNVSYNFTSHIY